MPCGGAIPDDSHSGHGDIIITIITNNYRKSDMNPMNCIGAIYSKWVKMPPFLLTNGGTIPESHSKHVDFKQPSFSSLIKQLMENIGHIPT